MVLLPEVQKCMPLEGTWRGGLRGYSPQPEEEKAWMDWARITWHVSHASTAPRVSGLCLGPVLPGPPPPLGWAPKLPGATTSARIGTLEILSGRGQTSGKTGSAQRPGVQAWAGRSLCGLAGMPTEPLPPRAAGSAGGPKPLALAS